MPFRQLSRPPLPLLHLPLNFCERPAREKVFSNDRSVATSVLIPLPSLARSLDPFEKFVSFPDFLLFLSPSYPPRLVDIFLVFSSLPSSQSAEYAGRQAGSDRRRPLFFLSSSSLSTNSVDRKKRKRRSATRDEREKIEIGRRREVKSTGKNETAKGFFLLVMRPHSTRVNECSCWLCYGPEVAFIPLFREMWNVAGEIHN